MPYVERDDLGRVTGISEAPQREGQEWVEEAELFVPFNQDGGIKRAKEARKLVLDALTGIAGRLQRAGDTANAQKCDTLATSLLAIDLKALAGQASDDEDYDTRVMTAYLTLAASAPPVVAVAFKELS